MIEIIKDADLVGKGVEGLPDSPGLSTEKMQEKFEEISKDVIIPKVNEIAKVINNNMYDNGYHMEYKYLNQTLGSESNSKPWLELKAQYSNLEVNVTYVGRINCGAQCTFIGMKLSDSYGGFLVIMYGYFYHVSVHNGTWYCKELSQITANDVF